MVKRSQAFTLIELLIVVAIIAILAAIAVPNFLEAQVRSKVSRVVADMRMIATGLESYKIDTNHYAPDSNAFRPWGPLPEVDRYEPVLRFLTTPISYMTVSPKDVFTPKLHWTSPDGLTSWLGYLSDERYLKNVDIFHPDWPDPKGSWALSSRGPDQKASFGTQLIFGMEHLESFDADLAWNTTAGALYDPTNGTVSVGDIARVGP